MASTFCHHGQSKLAAPATSSTATRTRNGTIRVYTSSVAR